MKHCVYVSRKANRSCLSIRQHREGHKGKCWFAIGSQGHVQECAESIAGMGEWWQRGVAGGVADLQAHIKVVGHPNHVVLFQGVVGQALHCLVVQKGHHQLLLALHLHCCCESALACNALCTSTPSTPDKIGHCTAPGTRRSQCIVSLCTLHATAVMVLLLAMHLLSTGKHQSV